MKDFEELLSSVYALLQGLDKHHEWVGGIIEEVVKMPKDQQQLWLESFTATIIVLMNQYPQMKEHHWFKDNPLEIAESYVKFHDEQRQKENK